VELESRPLNGSIEDLSALAGALSEFREYERLYRAFWPVRGLRPSAFPEPAALTLDRSNRRIREWAREAEDFVLALQRLEAEARELAAWEQPLAALGASTLDFTQLLRAGPLLQVRWGAMPADAEPAWPAGLLIRAWQAGAQTMFIAVGAAGDFALLEEAAVGVSPLPAWLGGSAAESLRYVAHRIPEIDAQVRQINERLRQLNAAYEMERVLGDAYRLQWVTDNVGRLDATGQFAWITGWTSDRDGQHLEASLARCGARALLHFPPPPDGASAPLLLVNPPWARPFEIFIRALGMPSRNEADPSRLLALVVPLLFGYMFGDVGQGLVLAGVAFWLRKHFPIARLFVAGGLCAAGFGLLFGSLFSLEAVLPALWLRPLESPLVVLAIPLLFGALLLTVGLAINALEAWWAGWAGHWVRAEAGILFAYLGILVGFVDRAGFAVAALATAFTFAAEAIARRRVAAGGAAVGNLVEHTLQLLINTLSFSRVGAFALAHAGLSAAILAFVHSTSHPLVQLLIMVVGNAFVLTLETLAVSIQTTRLVLFEFFTKFLVAGGRAFRPLPPPPFALEENPA
jgi:V/A-type H+-transporting ATPase subunit I